MPPMLTRTYDSPKKDQIGDFGYGWKRGGAGRDLRKNVAEGALWERRPAASTSASPPGGAASADGEPAGRRVYPFPGPQRGAVRLRRCRHQRGLRRACAAGRRQQRRRGLVGRSWKSSTPRCCCSRAAMIFDVDTGGPWDPTDYKFTAADGTVWCCAGMSASSARPTSTATRSTTVRAATSTARRWRSRSRATDRAASRVRPIPPARASPTPTTRTASSPR